MKPIIYKSLLLVATLLLLPCKGSAQLPAGEFINRGDAKRARSDLDGAIAEYTRAIELDPKNASVHGRRGLAKDAKGDLEGAIADFARAIELDPNDTVSYVNRGSVKDEKGDLDGAIADYTRAIELDPKMAAAYYNRGNDKMYLDNLVGAIADLHKAIELNPSLTWAYNNLAVAKQKKGDLAGAIAVLTRAIQIAPNFALAYGTRGNVNYLRHDWQKAMSDFKQYCKLDAQHQDNKQLYMWLIHTRLGENDVASKELSAFLDERSNVARGDWVSKVAGHLLGNVSEENLFAVATTKGQYADACFYVGMKKLFKGDKDAAAACFRKCVGTGIKSFTEYDFAQAELKAMAD